MRNRQDLFSGLSRLLIAVVLAGVIGLATVGCGNPGGSSPSQPLATFAAVTDTRVPTTASVPSPTSHPCLNRPTGTSSVVLSGTSTNIRVALQIPTSVTSGNPIPLVLLLQNLGTSTAYVSLGGGGGFDGDFYVTSKRFDPHMIPGGGCGGFSQGSVVWVSPGIDRLALKLKTLNAGQALTVAKSWDQHPTDFNNPTILNGQVADKLVPPGQYWVYGVWRFVGPISAEKPSGDASGASEDIAIGGVPLQITRPASTTTASSG